MKTIKLITILSVVLFFTSCGGQEKKERQALDESISRIEVYNFHSTHRCMTCNAIEANTKYTLSTYFSDEMERNIITNQVINVDENEEIAEVFEAAGTALILNVIKKGKETQIDLTDFAFMEGNNQESFSNELKDKIEAELKTL